MLLSNDQVPYNFTIKIGEGKAISKSTYSLEVTGKDPVTNKQKKCLYNIDSRTHDSYLNLFEKLANDYGLRLPRNRKISPKSNFKVVFHEVLTENIAPGILYGYGDPAVLRVEKEHLHENTWYYLLATSNDAPNSFPIIRSKNLIEWEFVDYVFPQSKKPEWSSDGEFISDYWAPEMHKIGNEFIVCFVARDKNSRELCIGIAKSIHPEGPFIADNQPILKGNVIDPHIMVQDDGKAFLYWKEDNNDIWPGRLVDLLYENPNFIKELYVEKEDQITASFILTLRPWIQTLEPMERFLVQQILIESVISIFLFFQNRLIKLLKGQPLPIQQDIFSLLKIMKTPVYAQQLSYNRSNLEGDRIKILENDLEWEAHLVEGMWVAQHSNKYYLFYAANDFSTDQYGIGVAIADSPLGPYKKMSKQFLQSTSDWWAPGHPTVVEGLDGQFLLFLHAYFPGKAGYKQFRALLSVPIMFAEDKVHLR